MLLQIMGCRVRKAHVCTTKKECDVSMPSERWDAEQVKCVALATPPSLFYLTKVLRCENGLRGTATRSYGRHVGKALTLSFTMLGTRGGHVAKPRHVALPSWTSRATLAGTRSFFRSHTNNLLTPEKKSREREREKLHSSRASSTFSACRQRERMRERAP